MSGRQLLGGFSEGMRMALVRAYAGKMMPYFLSGLQNIRYRAMEGLGTFGMTDTGICLYDPELVKKLFIDEAATILLHEYLHDFFNHAERFREMVRRGALDSGDHELWNNAADAEINDNLEDARCVFPRPEVIGGEHVTPTSLGLAPHRPAEEYAMALKKKGQKKPRPGKSGEGELPACGSVSGNPLEGEPEEDDVDGRDPVERSLQHKRDSEKVAQHEKQRGSIPGGITGMADMHVGEPTIPWERELEAEVAKAARYKQGQADYTYSLRSRFQGSLEMIYGEEAPVMPGMWAPVAEVALVVDTSGSMYSAIKKVVAEARGIIQTLGGARMTMVACDAQVHELKKIKSVEELTQGLKGGGGTDFRPAFDALLELPEKDRPDVVVFATDGYGYYPDEEPPWKHIWLNVDGEISVDWGKEIKASAD